MNRMLATGRLAADPEYRETDGKNGKVKVVTARVYLDGAGPEGADAPMTLKQFGEGAKPAVEFLRKGSFVAFDGRLARQIWTDEETGKTRERWEGIGHLEFGPKNGSGSGGREREREPIQEQAQAQEQSARDTGTPEQRALEPGGALELAQHVSALTQPLAAAGLGR